MGNYNISYIWTAWEAILLLTFLFPCAILVKSRFHTKRTLFILAGFTALSAALTLAVHISGEHIAFTLKMLSLTAYLPAILALHILSDSGFFNTVPIWCIGLFGMYAGRLSIQTANHLLVNKSLQGYLPTALQTLALILVAAAICLFIAKCIRRPFFCCVRGSDTNWTIPLALMLLLMTLISYFYNSTYDPMVSFLLFLTAAAALIVIARLFAVDYKRQCLKQEQTEYETRLQLQRNEFTKITQNHEQVRKYRHDMRHHLLALGQILHDSDSTYAEQYIDSLLGRLEDMETAIYCKNPLINAVLSTYISQARDIGCKLHTQISIPETLHIHDLDLCTALSNALENAIHACEKEPEADRFLTIKIHLRNSLCIHIQNSCRQPVSFDTDGLPLSTSGQGHGFGMKSIANTAAQYNGMFRCQCQDGIFKLNLILFNQPKEELLPPTRKKPKTAAAVLFSLISVCIFLNLSPITTQALADLPLVGPVVQVVTAKHHRSGWGQNRFSAIEPEVQLTYSSASVQKALTEHPAERKTSALTRAAAAALLAGTGSPDNASRLAALATPYTYGTKNTGSLFANGSSADAGSTSASEAPANTSSLASSHTANNNSVATAANHSPANTAASANGSHTASGTSTNSSYTVNGTSANGSHTADGSSSSGVYVRAPQLTLSADSGSSSVHFSKPDFGKLDHNTVEVPPALEEGVEDMNDQIDQYIETLRQTYIWYVNRKYMGYTALDAYYTILINDEKQLSVRFDGTLNVGGSVNFSRSFTLDKRTGKVLTLADLFQNGADYITPISSNILEQMAAQIENGTRKYYIPGTGWADADCFHHIAEDQNFYINNQGTLVIAFNEYEVAPGFMGCVEFEIPTSIISPLLRESTLIR